MLMMRKFQSLPTVLAGDPSARPASKPERPTKARTLLLRGALVIASALVLLLQSAPLVSRASTPTRGLTTITKPVHCVPVPDIPFRSQSNEDKALLGRYLTDNDDDDDEDKKRLCNGTVVEIGALDGIRFSNSYYFEYALHWRSILIEASPTNYERLVVNRPNAVNVHAAMCNDADSVEFVVGITDAVGAVVDTMSDAFRKRWSTNQTVKVPCSTLGKVFDQHNVRHIDLFSLDVEGAELAVLETMDWSVPVDVWVIEMDARNPVKSDAIRKLLRDHGYVKTDWNLKHYCTKGRACTGNEVYERVGKWDALYSSQG